MFGKFQLILKHSMEIMPLPGSLLGFLLGYLSVASTEAQTSGLPGMYKVL